MKARGNNIVVSGSELDAVAQEKISPELDAYISEILSYDVEYYQDEIDESTETCLEDWYKTANGRKAGTDVPRDRKLFRNFIKKGEPLRARDAATLLGYLIDDAAEERAENKVRLPRAFARELAAISIYRTARYTDEANTIPVDNLMVYREVQAMPSADHARKVWSRLVSDLTIRPALFEPYQHEFQRKRAEEEAGKSLGDANMLAKSYRFSLAKAVYDHMENNDE